MAHYVIFTKVVALTLTLTQILPKHFFRVLGPEYINCENFRKTGPVVWPVHREQTDKQTNKQMKGHSESAYFAKLDLQTEWFTL